MRKKRTKKAGKKSVNAIKRTYDGIDFDSTAEMDMYILLKKAGIPFRYVGKSKDDQLELFPEDTYQSECYERPQRRSKELKDNKKIDSMGYTPDFIGDNEEWVIEIKGRRMGEFNLRWKIFKHRMNQKKKTPILFMPVTAEDMAQVVNILIQRGYAKQ